MKKKRQEREAASEKQPEETMMKTKMTPTLWSMTMMTTMRMVMMTITITKMIIVTITKMIT